MATAQTLERQLQVVSKGLSPEAINAALASYAKAALAEAIANGEASERYVRSVNGVIDAPESGVKAPGPIIYQFSYLEEAALYALEFATQRSPEKSGAYKKAWFAMINGKEWDQVSPIPVDAEVVVTNDRPYHRKIDVGAMTMMVPPHITDDTRQALLRNYRGSVTAKTAFVDLAGAYRLRRNHARKGRMKGDPITYPAVIIGLA